jgi:hypothetical protein
MITNRFLPRPQREDRKEKIIGGRSQGEYHRRKITRGRSQGEDHKGKIIIKKIRINNLSQ